MNNHLFADTATLTGRSLRHILRSPDTIVTTAVTPVAMMLLFVYVFGATLGAGLAVSGIPTGPDAASMGREAYIAYIVPGILSMLLTLPLTFAALARARRTSWWAVVPALLVLPTFAAFGAAAPVRTRKTRAARTRNSAPITTAESP